MEQSSEDIRRVALVTGGSRGIGRSLVESLLANDWRVHFCSQSRDSLAKSQNELRSTYSDRVSGWLCDVRDQDQVDELVGRIANEDNRLDCLLNNAGVGLFSPVDELSGDDWRRVLQTNLDGAFYATRAVAPLMKAQRSGWILNIASLAGKHPFAGGAAYNASKAALLALSEASMLDLRPYGIRVAAILPGSVHTEFGQPKNGAEEGWKLAPEDIARTVVDLLQYPERALPSLVEIRPSRPPAHR